MIPNALPEDVILQGEGIFCALTEVERAVVRMYADGLTYDQIALHTDSTRSSVASAMSRACRKVGCSTTRMLYLVGIHDARAHARALREDIVHVVISRNGTVHRLDL